MKLLIKAVAVFRAYRRTVQLWSDSCWVELKKVWNGQCLSEGCGRTRKQTHTQFHTRNCLYECRVRVYLFTENYHIPAQVLPWGDPLSTHSRGANIVKFYQNRKITCSLYSLRVGAAVMPYPARAAIPVLVLSLLLAWFIVFCWCQSKDRSAHFPIF